MTDISIASDFSWNDRTARAQFLAVNGLSHQTIFQQFALNGQQTSLYPILDIEESERGHADWLANHYLMHQEAGDILGLDDLPSLADVNFYDPNDFNSWLQLHLQHHILIDQALGIT